ncbi:macrolide ABC transporter ATP-binding protein [candidate division WWE3 bacterium RIFCSPLOWO2_02_FULL_53_10]|uniref:Macrolide ABC transporter ATP-binding protein n=1 Tax=candidate division WWE3 bacterium RIFCSPLOWO2_02_FULL_53_10 TaxID=1802629 RepID=A0A1F4WFF5_UNCKA|nr:MAG: macrolide ABC transporter ATP-binding protein [candidate division WWE3 bacterium RIFCSPLOWO2_02_FULL_53_10]
MEKILNLEKVTKIYGTGETQVTALDGVSLEVASGEVVSVVGHSGSGKTTLLNMMGALDRPTSGRIFLEEEEISRIPEHQLYRVRREKIGFIFQSFHLIPTLNALENVLAPTLPLGERRFEERARELLESVGLGARLPHRPSQLSGGEMQRVAIARALIHEPKLILADEPTGNLDSKTGEEIINLLLRLNKEKGVTLVIVTHEPEIAKKADRTVSIRDGRIEPARV